MPNSHDNNGLVPWLAVAIVFMQLCLLTNVEATEDKTPIDVQGTWLGTLDAGPVKLRLGLLVSRSVEGSTEAVLVSIDQGNVKLKVDSIRIDNQDVQFTIKRVAGSFVGKVESPRKLTGTWKQAGLAFPLALAKVDRLPLLERPQDPREPYPYLSEDVVIPNEPAKVTLAGTITTPRGDGPFPAVILVSGSGPQDRNEAIMGHRPFLVLADHLTRNGIAVLRYDDRGVGQSTGDHGKATTADFADDALAVFKFLRARDGIDAGKIGMAGHSEGGIVAPIVATRTKDLGFIVMLAGTGVPGDQILEKQSEVLETAAGLTTEDVKKTLALRRRIAHVVKTVADDDHALAQITQILTEWPLPEEADASARDLLGIQFKVLLTPWFRHFMSYDPRPTLAKVECPALALFFEKDTQVVPGQNLGEVESALKKSGNRHVRVQEIPGLNHLMQTCQTGLPSEYGMIEETIAPAALEAISDWILQTIAE